MSRIDMRPARVSFSAPGGSRPRRTVFSGSTARRTNASRPTSTLPSGWNEMYAGMTVSPR